MRRLQLQRRSISSTGSNPSSPSPPGHKRLFSGDGEGSALSITSGSMDSYRTDGQQGERSDERPGDGTATESRWHDAAARAVDSPRRMDSGYATSLGGEDEKRQGSSDVPALDLTSSPTEEANASSFPERIWDCADMLNPSRRAAARYAVIVLNQPLPERWVFDQVWQSCEYDCLSPCSRLSINQDLRRWRCQSALRLSECG